MPVLENKYNKKELADKRATQEDPWVLYLLVRDSLNMSPGKIAAQVGHGVGLIYQWYINYIKSGKKDLKTLSRFECWKNQSFRKVTLKTKDKDWEKVKEKLDCLLVIDAGLTEIPNSSETIIVLFPMKKSERPNFLKKMQAL